MWNNRKLFTINSSLKISCDFYLHIYIYLPPDIKCLPPVENVNTLSNKLVNFKIGQEVIYKMLLSTKQIFGLVNNNIFLLIFLVFIFIFWWDNMH